MDGNIKDNRQVSTTNDENAIKRMMELEAAIKRMEADIKASEKKTEQIKKSNTWKRTAFLRKLFPSRRPHPELVQLEKEMFHLKEALLQAEETLAELRLQQESFDYDRVWRMMRDKKDAGEIADYIENVIANYHTQNENYKSLIHSTARLFMNEKETYRKLMYPKLFSGLKIEDIPEFMVRAGFSEDGMPLKDAASFRASLTMRMRKHQLHGTLPEMVLDDKYTAYEFAKMLDVRIPTISEKTYRHDEIPEEKGIVIKPVDGAGARGVYLVYDNNDIIDIKQSKKVANWQVLRKDMERDLVAGRVHRDEWFMEELILEDKAKKVPARDMKFYCFYGKVGLILEIIRYPELRHCWWTATGERVATGKYEETVFKGVGVNDEDIRLAEKISGEIPAPFIRIDFLRSDTGLVFGEFTPKPGNYDEFDDRTDQWLGDFFLDAEARLMDDLWNGKPFDHYKNLISNGSIDGDRN